MSLRNYSPEQFEQFRTEWRTFTTVEERMSFWRERIQFRYSLWSSLCFWDRENTVFEQSLSEFYIKPTSHATYGEEIERLNRLILEEVKEMEFIRMKKQLLDFDELKAKLDEKLSRSVRPIALLEEELKSVNEIVEKYTFRETGLDSEIRKKNSIKEAWCLGFNDYYLYGNDVDYKALTSEVVFLTAVYNGNIKAKYKEYIENRIKNPVIKKVSSKSKETSLKQQLLILRFLGILDTFKDWKQKDRDYILSVLLNRNPQNIKEAFLYLHTDRVGNEIWTETNLQFLIEQFSKIGLTEKVIDLEKKLKELKNKIDRIKSEK